MDREINELQKQVERLKKELADMKKQLKGQQPFEWEYPDGYTFEVLATEVRGEYSADDVDMLENGRYRICEHNAEHSLKLNRETNIIGALAEQVDTDDILNLSWKDRDQAKYSIYENRGEYYIEDMYGTRTLGVHYMSYEVAIEVCDVLNNKQISISKG